MANGNEVAQLAPMDLQDELPVIFQLAEKLIESRSILPAHCKTVGDIVGTILAGRELGLPPMTALRMLYAINGKLGMDASLILALLARGGVRHRWLADGSDVKAATLRLERQGYEPFEFTYSWQDATRASLVGKNQWKAHPTAMLRARCVSAAARAFAPDLALGCYVPDELDEIAERETAEAPPAKAATNALDAIAEKHAPKANGNGKPAESKPAPKAEQKPAEKPPESSRPSAESAGPSANMINGLDAVEDDTHLKRWIDAYRGPLLELKGEERKAMGYMVSQVAKRVGVSDEQVKEWVHGAKREPSSPGTEPAEKPAANDDEIEQARAASAALD